MKNIRSKMVGLMRGCVLFSVVVLAGTAPVCAQTDEDPTEPPAGPLLKPAPASAQWTITFTYKEDQKAKDPAFSPDAVKSMVANEASLPRTIVTTKTGEIIHEETTTVGGTKTDDWQVSGNYYVKFPGNNYWSAYEKTDTNLTSIQARTAMILPSSGFSGLDWISSESYAGKSKIDSGDSLVFVPGGMGTVHAGDPGQQSKLQSLPKVAYINAETRLPVMVRDAGATRQFTFSASPSSEAQVLPADLADEIKKGDAIRAQRNGAPGREF